MKIQEATLFISSSETDSNLYYATRFLAPDPFIYLEAGDEKVVLMSDLELDRARSQARVTTVLSYSAYEEAVKKSSGTENPTVVDVVSEFLRERQIKRVVVPSYFGISNALLLQEKGYDIDVRQDPFFEQRVIKREDEVKHIEESLRLTESAVKKAIEYLRQAEIRDGFLYSGNRKVTSEDVRKLIDLYLMENSMIAQHTIVACGEDSSFPHNEGSGALRANVPVIIDVFPRSVKSRYYADITRTVVRGVASEEIKKMFDAVSAAQEIAFAMIRNEVNGRDVHEAILGHFKNCGFESGLIDGRMQGFFHGTGHGVGLDIHEAPRISRKTDILRTGHVVTVEPGLYYRGLGGVRLEDMVVVQADGVVNLTRSPRILEI
ncbi:MAG: aminopeptidase P family protein [Nitrospirae bacterium]|nr:aminopeptidase P family protein [Nitrospirota bacterium]